MRNDNSSVIRQKGEFQNGCFKKAKHVKFSENRTYPLIRTRLLLMKFLSEATTACSVKKGVLKNFTGKHLCLSCSRSATLLKRNTFFSEHLSGRTSTSEYFCLDRVVQRVKFKKSQFWWDFLQICLVLGHKNHDRNLILYTTLQQGIRKDLG